MPKLKKCKECKSEFEPRSMGHTHCSPKCAILGLRVRGIKKTKTSGEPKFKKDIKKKPTRSQEMKLTQKVFNEYIRLRDAADGCISCGTLHSSPSFHAGHYMSVGARPQLRLEPLNVHKQCARCNTFLHGNLINYRIALINKITKDVVEKLESGAYDHPKRSAEDLRDIRKSYREKIKDIMGE